MSRQMGRVLVGLVGAATVAALMVPGAAFARGPGSGGGGGGPGEEVAANNLSVPAVFVKGGVPTGVACDGETKGLVLPEAGTIAPVTGFTIDSNYYYVQGVHKWQAQCITADSATATAEWGDNLAGDAKLKVGSPIRVEVGLVATSANGVDLPAMTGWDVLKLQPELLDRNSQYGTLAAGPELGAVSYAKDLTLSTRVKDAAAMLAISGTAIADGIAIAPEINAAGKVVYGYNLRVDATGTYVITFTFPNVTIEGVDVGTFDVHTVTLPITVGGGGGGGGGRPTR